MVRYVAFLRAINVGGSKVIKMERLRQIFEEMGFANVATYIQTGNVFFDARQKNAATVRLKIEQDLERALGHDVGASVVTFADFESLIERNPFKRVKTDDDVMLFTTFLQSEPTKLPELPLVLPKENLEVIACEDRVVLITARRKPDGRFGFPNNFIEKQFGVSGTTRYWHTVKKMLEDSYKKTQKAQKS